MKNPLQNSVLYLTPPLEAFEKAYLNVRKKEARILEDGEVKQLPNISSRHPHAPEWAIRKKTVRLFREYLMLRKPAHLLEIGCGNGWFANTVSDLAGHVTGLDVGSEELEQAARCFGGENRSFVCCSDWELLPEGRYDLIVFNASIQYFQLNAAFFDSLYRLLAPGGTVHLLDSPFYAKKEQPAAADRSLRYYNSLKSPETAAYYRHHTLEELPDGFQVVRKPSAMRRNLLLPGRIKARLYPFYWILFNKRS